MIDFIGSFFANADAAHYALLAAVFALILSGKLHGKFFGWTIGSGANGKKSAVVGNPITPKPPAAPAITKDDLREMEARFFGKLEDFRRELKEDLRQHDANNHTDFKQLRDDIRALWAARKSDK